MANINFFKDITKKDVSLAGGKGASLGEMYNANFSVPYGFVILSSAFEKHIKENNLDIKIIDILKKITTKETTIENASKNIQKLIIDTSLSKDLEKEVLVAFKQLETSFVAVRSSATAEDSLEDAWAGQLDTFLYVSEQNIIENIKKCWSSLFTERAIFYRIEKKLLDKKISVAVVVQKMVNSEKSGIAFSVNPVTNNRQEIIIDAGYGLGEAIVSGQITPDNYIVNKDLTITKKTKGRQEKGIFRKDNDSGTVWKDLSLEDKNNFVLSDKEVIELSKIIINLENHYGFPVDVEWAIENNKIYITQSRPITTLKE
jgi:pyruvate, water dikinase